MKQPPVKEKTILILENLEKSSLSELLGDFLAPLENRSTESPYTFQKGKENKEHAKHYQGGSVLSLPSLAFPQ